MKPARMKMVALAVLVGALILVTCQPKVDLRAQCCTECNAAWSKSPAGIGPEGAYCGQFTTAEKVSSGCAAYFTDNPTTVSLCNTKSQ